MVSVSDYNDVFSRVKKHFTPDNPQITDHQIRLEILIAFEWIAPRGISLYSSTEVVDGEMYIWIMQRSNNKKSPLRIKLIHEDTKLSVLEVTMTHNGPL